HPPIWVGGDSAGAFRRDVAPRVGWRRWGQIPAGLRARSARRRAAPPAPPGPGESPAKSPELALTASLALPRPPWGTHPWPAGEEVVSGLFGGDKQVGPTLLMVDVRGDDLGRMLELLELVATKVRPAVAA